MPNRAPISPAVDRNDWFPPLPEHRQNPAPEPDQFITMNWLYESDWTAPGGAPWIVPGQTEWTVDTNPALTHTITLPRNLTIGNTVWVLYAWPYTYGSVDWPAGWTSCGTISYGASMELGGKVIDGTEGETVDLTEDFGGAPFGCIAFAFEVQDGSDPSSTPPTWGDATHPIGGTEVAFPDPTENGSETGNVWMYLAAYADLSDLNSVVDYPDDFRHYQHYEVDDIGNGLLLAACALRSITEGSDLEVDPMVMALDTTLGIAGMWGFPGDLVGVADKMIWAYDGEAEAWRPHSWFDLDVAPEDHQHYGEDASIYLDLQDLENVTIDGTPADHELLIYDEASGEWINATSAEAQVAPLTHVGSTGTEVHGVATTDVAGFMAAADKTKLDGIEAAATADQTANEILTALLGVDGTGSLLDADLLDGSEATAFASSTHDHDSDYADIAHVHGLDDLSDVTLGTPSTGNVLTYDTDHWEAAAPGASSLDLDDLGDVVISGDQADNEILGWDSSTGKFINQTAAELGLAGGVSALDDLTDVTVAVDIADNDLLTYVTDHWENQTLAEAGVAAAGHDHDSDYAAIAHNHDSDYMDIAAALADLSNVDATAPSTDDVLTWDGDSWGPAAPSGGGGGTQAMTLIYTVPDALEVSTGVVKFMLPFAVTIVSCRALVGTAPTGASAIIDVNVDGTTIYSTQGNRPTITTGNTDSGSWSAPDVTSFSANSYFTVDIDQIGSTIAGANLTLMIYCTRSVA